MVWWCRNSRGSGGWLHWCIGAYIFLNFTFAVNSLSVSPSSSPWADALWKIGINLGRDAGSTMPESWGASGSRLCVRNLLVSVESERMSEGTGAFQLRPLSPCPTYVTLDKGSQPFSVVDGGWTLEFPANHRPGQASTLNMWLELGDEGCARNDISLEGGARLYGKALCWRERDYDLGRKFMVETQLRLDRAERQIWKNLNHDTGDRRLDGRDGISTTLKAYTDMALLVRERDMAKKQYIEASRDYPPVVRNAHNKEYTQTLIRSDDESDNRRYQDFYLPEGPWPGAIEWLSISNNNLLYISQSAANNILNTRQQHHLIGTWDIEPILTDDQYEEVDIL